MSYIFPGNYVAHLNAYRNQAVLAIPGVEFYRLIGVAQLDASDASGATYALKILSPDLRQDDKPRVDKPFVIPTGASIYRTAINTSNLSTANGKKVTVTGPAGGAETTADSSGVFDVNGGYSAFAGLASITPEAADLTVTAVSNDGLTIVDADDQAAIIVEVDFFMNHPAPGTDDINLPYKVEAGQGT